MKGESAYNADMLDRAVFMKKYRMLPASLYSKKKIRARNVAFNLTSGTTSKLPTLVTIYRDRTMNSRFIFRSTKKLTNVLVLMSRDISKFNYISDALFFGTQVTRVLVLDDKDYHASTRKLITEFETDAIFSPHGRLKKLQGVLGGKVSMHNVTFMNPVGELQTRRAREAWARTFPGAEIAATYGMSELGATFSTMQAPCIPQATNRVHPGRGIMFEIHKPDRFGVGEIMVSKRILPKKKIHQRLTGDMGRLIPGKCVCGASITLEMLGRYGFDYVPFAHAGLTLGAIEDALYPVQRSIQSFRVEVSSGKDGLQMLRLTCVPKTRHARTPKILQDLRSQLLASVRTTEGVTLRELLDTKRIKRVTCAWGAAPRDGGLKEIRLRLKNEL